MPRQILVVACLLAIAATSNTNSFGLVFAPAAESLGVSVSVLGGLRTIENVAAIIVAILIAPQIDRFQRKYVMLTGYGLATVGALVLVLTAVPAGALVYFMLTGASIMLIIGSLTAMPGDFVSGRGLNRVMGIIIGSVAFTSILVAPVVGSVSERFDWQAGMLVSAGVTSTAFLLTLLVIPGYRVEASDSSSEGLFHRYRLILGQTPVLLMLGNNLLRFAQHGTVMTFTSTVLITRYDLALGRIGQIFALMGIVFFLFSVLCGLMLHVIKTRRVLVWGGLGASGLYVFMLVIHTPIEVMVLCLVVTVGLIAAQVNTGTVAVLRLLPWARGAAMSWNELAVGVGFLLGIGSGSIGLAVGGVSGLGVALVIIALLSVVVSLIALRLSGYTDEEDVRAPGPASS